MEEKEVKTWHILVFTALVAFMIFVIYNKPKIEYITIKNECKEDSLRNVIGQLENDLKNEEDGWDNKEKNYEQIIFEYEYGLDHLKTHQPNAYKEFHRIIGFKEKFTRENERDNIKRLTPYE